MPLISGHLEILKSVSVFFFPLPAREKSILSHCILALRDTVQFTTEQKTEPSQQTFVE